MSLLAREIDAYYDGFPHAEALLDAVRHSELIVPLSPDGRPLCVSDAGLTWVCAFTDRTRLARFAVARRDGDREWDYARVPGSELSGLPSGTCTSHRMRVWPGVGGRGSWSGEAAGPRRSQPRLAPTDARRVS